MSAPNTFARPELHVNDIIKWFGKQDHFPRALEVGPETVMKWMKAMNTSQTEDRLKKKIAQVLTELQKHAGLTRAQCEANIKANGQNLDEPVVTRAFYQGPLDPKRQARKKRQQKQAKDEARAKENADARTRAKAKSKAKDDANDDQEIDTLFAGTFRRQAVMSSDMTPEEDAGDFSEWDGFSDNDDEAMDVELSQPFPLKIVTPTLPTNTSA